MKKVINMHEAKTHLSKIALEVEQGEEVVIARFGKPIMKLVRVEPETPKKVIFGLGSEILKDFDWDEIEASGHWVWQERGKCSCLDESSFPQPLQLPPTNL
jgi:antitoxin (DNA-binding transcriptional repressor) of toxin-antitoxin stability system